MGLIGDDIQLLISPTEANFSSEFDGFVTRTSSISGTTTSSETSTSKYQWSCDCGCSPSRACSGGSSSSGTGSLTNTSTETNWLNGDYEAKSTSKSTGNTTFSSQESCQPTCPNATGKPTDSNDSGGCNSSSTSQSSSSVKIQYSNSRISRKSNSNYSNSSTDSCGSGGGSGGGSESEEWFDSFGTWTSTDEWPGEGVSAVQHFTARVTHSDGKITDTPDDPQEIKNFGGAFGAQVMPLYTTKMGTWTWFGVDVTYQTTMKHYINAFFEKAGWKQFTTQQTVVNSKGENITKEVQAPEQVISSWAVGMPINPKTITYGVWLVPDRHGFGDTVLFTGTGQPKSAQYLAAKMTSWSTTFSKADIAIQAVLSPGPNATGEVTISYDLVQNEGKTVSSLYNNGYGNVYGVDNAWALSTSNVEHEGQQLSFSQAEHVQTTGFSLWDKTNTDPPRAHYKTTVNYQQFTTLAKTAYNWNKPFYTTESKTYRQSFYSKSSTSWVRNADYQTVNKSDSGSGGDSKQTEDSYDNTCFEFPADEYGPGASAYCSGSGTNDFAWKTAFNGSTMISVFPPPFILDLWYDVFSSTISATPVFTEQVFHGLAVPLKEPSKGATINNDWAVFRRLGFDEHARAYGENEAFLRNPARYLIPYNGPVTSYSKGAVAWEGNQVMDTDGSGVTLFYKTPQATKYQTKISNISPAAGGSMTRSVRGGYFEATYHGTVANACATNRSGVGLKGLVEVRGGSIRAITSDSPATGAVIWPQDDAALFSAYQSLLPAFGGIGYPIRGFHGGNEHNSPASWALYNHSGRV